MGESELESELEDTGSKVSSNSNIRQNADAPQEVEDESEANKMQEDSLVSKSEVVEQALNGEGNSNNASSGVVQEAAAKHLPVSSDEKVSDGRPEDSSVLNEKVEDDKTLDEKAEDDTTSDEVSIVETDSRSDSRHLLNYCSFARIPTRPRSVLAHRNAGPTQREIAAAGQIDAVSSEEVSRMTLDGRANANSLPSIQAEADSKDALVGQEHAGLSTACNQVAESVTFHETETQGKTEEIEEQNNIPQNNGVQDEHNELSPALASHQNILRFHVEKGIQIYNIDTPPQDEELIDSSDKGKTVPVESSHNIEAEAIVTMEEEKLTQSSSFKIRDLNLVGSPEVAEMRTDPHLGQCSTAGCSVELQDMQQVDFGTTVGNNQSNTDTYALLGNKEVQVIDIEDDPPNEAGACDTSKAKSEMVYSSMENMMNPPANTDVLHGIQDGYSLAISDYLGADMPIYQSIQTDLQAGMGLNGSEGITVMDDPIYSALGDIGFMEVWDQPPQDYEKFF
uniref:Uncharacterized protein n=1 Tax=Arundo donax TaxID=35708 RepID=A0A0A9EZM0_ARUDO